MKNYYIYHITGIKIGCTVNVPHRMREQGFTEWEHLETHTDIYEASNREIELQKEYGLPVDKVPYWQAVANRYKLTKEDHSKGGQTSKSSIAGKMKRSITFELAQQIRSEYNNCGNLSSTTKTGLSQNELAAKYNTTRNVIAGIVQNRMYLEE